MRIALVDDESIYTDEITDICRKFFGKIDVKAEISAFADAKSFLDSLSGGYDIVFMDIYMDGTDGIYAAKKLRERCADCILIFTTSSMEHMPDAFLCHAFEYIVKPFERQRVTDVLNDALKRLPQELKYIDVYSGRKNLRIPLEKVVSVATDAHYLDITLSDETTLRCRMTMPMFLEQTDNDPRFITINQGITINADFIADFENNCCILKNGSHFPIRVRNRLKIEQLVRDYNFDKIRSVQKSGKERFK